MRPKRRPRRGHRFVLLPDPRTEHRHAQPRGRPNHAAWDPVSDYARRTILTRD